MIFLAAFHSPLQGQITQNELTNVLRSRLGNLQIAQPHKVDAHKFALGNLPPKRRGGLNARC